MSLSLTTKHPFGPFFLGTQNGPFGELPLPRGRQSGDTECQIPCRENQAELTEILPPGLGLLSEASKGSGGGHGGVTVQLEAIIQAAVTCLEVG